MELSRAVNVTSAGSCELRHGCAWERCVICSCCMSVPNNHTAIRPPHPPERRCSLLSAARSWAAVRHHRTAAAALLQRPPP